MFSLFRHSSHHQAQAVLAVSFSDMSVQVMLADDMLGIGAMPIYAVVDLPTGAVVAGRIIDKSACHQALNTALISLKDSPVPAKISAISCVADEAVMIKRISLAPHLNDDEIDEHLALHAERYISQPLSDVYYDFIVLSKASQTEILLTVAHRSAVDDIVDVLALAGLETLAIDVASHAMRRSLCMRADIDTSKASFETPRIICSLGYECSQLVMIQSDGAIQAETLLMGIATGMPSAQSHQPSPEALAELDLSPTKLPALSLSKPHLSAEAAGTPPTIADMSDSSAQIIADNLLRAISPFITSATDAQPSILLAGLEIQHLAKIAAILKSNTDLTIKIANPLPKTDHDDEHPAAPMLMTVHGLASVFDDPQPALNLLPWRAQHAYLAGERFKKQLISVAAITALLLAIIYAAIVWQTQQAGAINDEITQRIDANQAKITKISAITTQMKIVGEQLSAIEGLNSDVAMMYWQKLGSLVPTGVYLDQLSIQKQSTRETGVPNQDQPPKVDTGRIITLNGHANNAAGVSTFAAQLELAGYHDVLVVAMTQSTKGNIGFSLTALQPNIQTDAMQSASMNEATDNPPSINLVQANQSTDGGGHD